MFTNGENLQGKNPPSDFKVTIPENPLLSQQAVTSKGILVPYTNLQLNPYPNTQLDLFCSDNLSFSMHGSQYMTNHQLEKDVDCKVLQFYQHDEDHEAPWLQNPTAYKRSNLFKRKMN